MEKIDEHLREWPLAGAMLLGLAIVSQRQYISRALKGPLACVVRVANGRLPCSSRSGIASAGSRLEAIRASSPG